MMGVARNAAMLRVWEELGPGGTLALLAEAGRV